MADFTKDQITLTRKEFCNIVSSTIGDFSKEFAEKDHELGVMSALLVITFGAKLEKVLFDGGEDVKQ